MIRPFLSSPLYQALAVSALMVLALLLYRFKRAPRAGWNAAALLLLLFCVWTAAAGIWAANIWRYLAVSIGLFVLLFLLAPRLASTLSGMSLDEFGPDAMVFLAPILYYPGLLLAMGLLRLLIH